MLARRGENRTNSRNILRNSSRISLEVRSMVYELKLAKDVSIVCTTLEELVSLVERLTSLGYDVQAQRELLNKTMKNKIVS
jgi:hypothetical protein